MSANGAYPASGETITITINGNAQITTINDASGDFSIDYNSTTLPTGVAPYSITYSYAGDAWLNPTTDASTTLSVLAPPVIQSAMLSGTTFTFTWNTITNQIYQIQATASLAPADWTYVGGLIISSNATSTYSQAIGTNLEQYYRIVLWP